ncbi:MULTISPECIES: VanZ family protein [unclassified Streptomyces]|uniref:VanZ family protein n=1 Tax=unclassified Streptomyces TaxID=2593676 RepID=UPI002365DAEA|nr:MULTISPECIES: VanZ family protein [unclassified Streptomyces]MDF3140696.1 VanZ family protein [Streptomyces sp. T21Q-yed]WDF40040.1 VanZ family protein [Streptomyces sp. T12]
MFTAIFENHYDYLVACTLTALVLGGAAWLVSRRLGSPYGVWWAGLAGALTGVLGVTFMGSGPATGQCVINHNLAEPFHTTQGLWNLLMTVPLGLFTLLALRRLLPALVGVVALPLAIEFTQATANGLGRVCDSADAEMNILGGLAGLAIAAGVLARRGALHLQAGAKASMIAFAVLLILGTGVARPMLSFTNLDGTGLSAAGSSEREAVEQVVQEAFGDRYKLGHVYVQPCVGAPCTNIAFTLLSRDGGHPEAFSNGSLSWPDKKHLNVLLEDSDRPSVMGYPVAGAKAPSTEQEAYRIAQTYMNEHYPWAKDAVTHRTYQVGEKAELGWMTSWRWLNDDVLMPRMLDVQVDRAGRVSQVDVTLGPKRMKTTKAKLDAGQAEEAVREGLVAQNRANGGGDLDRSEVKAKYQIDAFTLKAVEREGAWRPEWLVNVSMRAEKPGADPQESGGADMWRVDAVNGQVYDGTDAPVKAD